MAWLVHRGLTTALAAHLIEAHARGCYGASILTVEA
jgi:hypothetical protein